MLLYHQLLKLQTPFHLADPRVQPALYLLKGRMIQRIPDLPQGEAVIAQPHAFQQRHGLLKCIIVVTVFQRFGLNEAELLVMLEQIGTDAHISGIIANPVHGCCLFVRHALHLLPT